MSMYNKLCNIEKALELADDLLTDYCEIYDIYVLRDEEIEQIQDEEEKQQHISIKYISDTILKAKEDLKEIQMAQNRMCKRKRGKQNERICN